MIGVPICAVAGGRAAGGSDKASSVNLGGGAPRRRAASNAAYRHAVIDNFSRRILAWRVADTFAPVNSVAVLLDASRGATSSDTTPHSCWQMRASRT